MSTIATIVVRRASGAGRDSSRTYSILLDGVHRGDVKPGEQLSLVVAPGKRSVMARRDRWFRSPKVLLEVAPGQVHTLSVASGGSAWAIFQLFTPHSYLKLSPESSHFGSGPPAD